jgi:hypothetical protein
VCSAVTLSLFAWLERGRKFLVTCETNRVEENGEEKKKKSQAGDSNRDQKRQPRSDCAQTEREV